VFDQEEGREKKAKRKTKQRKPTGKIEEANETLELRRSGKL
jgi:hypothetical protein